MRDNQDAVVVVEVAGGALGDPAPIAAVPFALQAGEADRALIAEAVAGASIDAAALAANAVANVALADDAVGANEIADGAVEARHLASGAVPITPWTEYPAALSIFGGGGVGNQITRAVFRRVGDSIEVRIQTTFSALPPQA